MTHFHDVISELRDPTRELRHAIPETWAGFASLSPHLPTASNDATPPLSTAGAQVVTTEGPIQALRPCSPDAILGNLAVGGM